MNFFSWFFLTFCMHSLNLHIIEALAAADDSFSLSVLYIDYKIFLIDKLYNNHDMLMRKISFTIERMLRFRSLIIVKFSYLIVYILNWCKKYSLHLICMTANVIRNNLLQPSIIVFIIKASKYLHNRILKAGHIYNLKLLR